MKNGKLADAQLRALIDVAAAAAGAHRLEEVLELAAERSLEAIDAASLSISRWHPDTGILQTLVNVGDLGPGEERFPKDEVYSVEDFPSLNRLMGEFESSLTAVDDPDSDAAGRALLRRLGKEASLAVPMLLKGRPWGELEAMTAPGRPRLTQQDVEFLRAIADQLAGAIHRAELFAEIERLAFTDSLTGVATRRAAETALHEAFAHPSREDVPALILCDIDNLKHVNDTGGHAAGDRALMRVAEALVEASGEYEDAVVARFGGDEFCVVLPSGTADDARAVALDTVRRLDAGNGERLSCGVAARSGPEIESADLLRAADEAQYRAKRTDGVDVVVAGEDPTAAEELDPPDGRDRAFRASDPNAQLARELLELIDEMVGWSADDKLARLRSRLERDA
jgi:diguanylate cyclase (GGDEF)-like protein